MRPLRIKSSGTPPSSANFQGLQEMTDGEINQYLSYVITNKFADDTNGTGTAELNVDTANALTGTSIGTFTDTIRNDSIGTHPTAGATSSTTYYFKQVTAAASESITNRLVGYDSAIKEMTDSDLDTDILDKVIDDMVSETNYTVGQYSLASTSPSGGTWTSRYTITDTAQGGNTVTYLWQKTAPTTSANSNLTSLKVEGTSGVKMMSAAEIEQIVPNFRNRIISNNIGKYAVQATAPGTGTWVQMGDAFSDTRQTVSGSAYAGSFAGTYAGNFTGNYAGNFAGNYVGAKTYTGAYTGAFSGNYAGNYVGTSAYAGAYSGVYNRNFSGNYVRFFSGFVGGTFTGFYTGFFTGFYTGFYTGAKTYTGTYTGAYNRNFTGNYVGTSAYSGTYSGTYTGIYTSNFTGNYSGSYTGNTIQAGKDTVSTVKLWLRTA
jgi:hypothetical protein